MVVADGLGGRRAGEIASSLLVETLTFGVLETTSELNRTLSTREVEQLLRDTIVRANGAIMTQGRFNRREETRGMATTCVAAIVDNGLVTIGHVGDSRIYLQRGEEMRQLTQDHSEVYEELIKGNITEEEARNHRFRNQITRAVGLDPNVRPDISTLELQSGDTVLLCSDGLTTELPDHAISDILCTAPTAQAASDKLVKIALRSGGRDNITVVVMRYGDFVPLGEFEFDLEPEAADDTDPIQNWKRPVTERDLEKPDWRDDPPIPTLPPERKPDQSFAGAAPGVPVSVNGKFASIAPALVFLLVLGMLVEGAIIVNLRKQADTRLQTPLPGAGNQAPKSPGSMVYDPVKLVMDARILPDYLQISPKGNPIVAKTDGTLVTVLVSEHRLLPMGPLYPVMRAEGAKRPAKAQGAGDIFCDEAGTIYYLNPETRCIETYTSTGTRTNQDLGKSQLTSPSRISTDAHGNIYVIDDGHLKVLNMRESGGKASHPSGADF